MKRWLGALAFVGATAASSAAFAQEIQIRGPLAGAPSCRRCVQYRVGRVEVAPTFGITLQDEFDRTMFLGAQVNYHLADIFAIGVWGGFGAVHLPTPLTEQIGSSLSASQGMAPDPNNPPDATANIPRGNRFRDQVGQLNWILVPQLTLIPLRGKLALFQNIFVDTDFYLFAGPAFVGLTERAPFDSHGGGPDQPLMPVNPNSQPILDSQTNRASRVAITGSFGVGLNFYINRFLSLAIEYRAFPFAWNTMGTDENTTASTCGAAGNATCQGHPDYAVDRDTSNNRDSGGRFVIDENDRAFRWNQMINVSFNIFLPTEARVSP